MPALPIKIELEDVERAQLDRLVRAHSAEQRLVDRARIVLLASQGLTAEQIAECVGCHSDTVDKWRARFRAGRMDALGDLPRSGKPMVHGPEVRARLIAKACTRPPTLANGQRRGRWTYQQLGEAAGMSRSQAYKILQAADIKPHLVDGWVMSDLTPEFFAQAGEVCGLYVDPPDNAIVLSIDEKTGIQAKGLARPDTHAAPGRPGRRDNEYVRNGTQNLCTSLEVHAGTVTATTGKGNCSEDFIGFLDFTDQHLPADATRVIAVMDNLATHKTNAVQDWLDDHPRWEIVFTPTHASWLNQVEIFFSILTRQLLTHGAFDSEDDLAEQLLAYIETYNQTATPFKWTYTGKLLAA